MPQRTKILTLNYSFYTGRYSLKSRRRVVHSADTTEKMDSVIAGWRSEAAKRGQDVVVRRTWSGVGCSDRK